MCKPNCLCVQHKELKGKGASDLSEVRKFVGRVVDSLDQNANMLAAN